MDDDARTDDRAVRRDALPAHEDDSDVAAEGGGGILQEGRTAEVRGTGERTGNAQGLDAEATSRDPGEVTLGGEHEGDPPRTAGDATPGIHDFTQTLEQGDADRR